MKKTSGPEYRFKQGQDFPVLFQMFQSLETYDLIEYLPQCSRVINILELEFALFRINPDEVPIFFTPPDLFRINIDSQHLVAQPACFKAERPITAAGIKSQELAWLKVFAELHPLPRADIQPREQ